MKRIAVTPPLSDAAAIAALAPEVVALLDEARCSRVHLRFPQAPVEAVETLMALIPARLHPRLSIHDFQETAARHGAGVHLTGRRPALEVPREAIATLSASCHSAQDVEAAAATGVDYVTVSPVFDSISKEGYRAAGFTNADYRRMHGAGVPLIALGGVSPATAPALPEGVFDGYAMLGAIPWTEGADAIIKKICI